MAKKVISHPVETSRRRSASQRSFHERARIAMAQVKLLKELFLNEKALIDQMSEEDLDAFLDAVEDPGSSKANRSKGSTD